MMLALASQNVNWFVARGCFFGYMLSVFPGEGDPSTLLPQFSDNDTMLAKAINEGNSNEDQQLDRTPGV